MTLPVPGQSRAVLIGAHTYDHLPELAGVQGNVEGLRDFLVGDDGWKLAPEHCLDRLQSTDSRGLLDELAAAAQEATDTLLIYYAGHGDSSPGDPELRLALPDVDVDLPHRWLRYSDVRQIVTHSNAARRVVVLDCCFAGRAVDGGMSATAGRPVGERFFELADMEGAVVLTAASGQEEAVCPPGATYSAFTGELLRLLREGVTGLVPQHPEGRRGEELQLLDIATVYACLRDNLTGREVAGLVLPEPQLGTRNHGGVIVLGRNPAYVGAVAPPFEPLRGPSTLGPVDAVFVGREDALATIEAAAEEVLQPGGGPAVLLVHGMGGVGKSALLGQAAVRVKDRFPDGRFEIDLNGFEEAAADGGPGSVTAAPATPEVLLERLLSWVGHPRIPVNLQERRREWLAWLAGRRVLLMLDNAADADLVASLLPGPEAHCLCLISSRNQDFPVAQHRRIPLGELDEESAVRLLREMSGLRPDTVDDSQLAALARQCRHLPLALRPAGAKLRHADPADVLSVMTDGDDAGGGPFVELPTADEAIRRAFRTSYAPLPEHLRTVVRHCAWHPGRTYPKDSIAAMAGLSPGAAALRLGDLVDVHLLQRGPDGQAAFHDLFLIQARQATAVDAAVDRTAARERLYGHLLTHLSAALLPLAGQTPRRLASAARASFDGPREALGWLRSHSDELEAASAGAMTDRWDRANRLAMECARWLRYDGRHDTAVGLCQQALDLAKGTGDPRGQTNALTGLAHTHRLRDEHDTAAALYKQALGLAIATGDSRGQTYALTGLAATHRLRGEYDTAAALYPQALDLAEGTGDPRGQTYALTGLADTHRLRGEYDTAAALYPQALDLAKATGDPRGQTYALTGLAHTHRLRDEHHTAAALYDQALDLAKGTGDPRGQTNALTGLAHTHRLRDEHDTAAALYEQALELAEDTGDGLGQANALTGLADTHRAQGEFDAARRRFRQALGNYESIGVQEWAKYCRDQLHELGDHPG